MRGEKCNKQWFVNDNGEIEELSQTKNKIRGYSHPAWVDTWQDFADKLIDDSVKDINKIFPGISLDPIEDLPLSAKERKEMHELMEKMGITKREDRTTAMLILSTRPQDVNFKDFSKEPMLKAPRTRVENDVDKQESIVTRMAKIIRINTDI